MHQQDVYAGPGSIAYALVKLSGLPRILREAATGGFCRAVIFTGEVFDHSDFSYRENLL